MSNPKKLETKDYEQLGRAMATVYETGYLKVSHSLRMSFLRGVFQGFGAVVGATVLVALLVWLLTLFGNIPLVGRLAENLKDTVNSSQTESQQ